MPKTTEDRCIEQVWLVLVLIASVGLLIGVLSLASQVERLTKQLKAVNYGWKIQTDGRVYRVVNPGGTASAFEHETLDLAVDQVIDNMTSSAMVRQPSELHEWRDVELK